MRVTVCGARGSTPSPGPGTVRYGGETTCLVVGDGDGPGLVLDIDDDVEVALSVRRLEDSEI